ncbi:MAG: RluA family pseudouridine synthase [Actinobacteria bacterium]|nr:RluA family pseudouridine synthase [Actinomycetota bacterium]
MDGDHVIEVRVEADVAGARLDVFVGGLPGVGSRSRAEVLISGGAVLVDGAVRQRSHRLKAGQVVQVIALPPSSEEGGPPQAENMAVPVTYEDEFLLVVDKPAGLVVHPAQGHPTGTLVNALLHYGLAGGEVGRPGIVHRLDKDTSGLMVVVRDADVHARLVKMIRQRVVKRCYLALVHGRPAQLGTIEAPIGRHPRYRKTMTVGGATSREAVTHFAILEEFRNYTLVEAGLQTGRTHQIRVHFRAIGHPVCGDPVYCRRDPLRIGRQFLHSHQLAFRHPVTGEELSFRSPLPEDLARVVARLRETGGTS